MILKKGDTERFILKAKEVHGNTYSYNLTVYTTNKNKVEIICKEHGVFSQEASSHIKGYGCYQCGRKKCVKSKTLSQEDFLEKAKKVHGDRYDYSKTVYISMNRKVTINCNKHGLFEQTPSGHIYRENHCPKCDFTISKPEIELQEFVKSLGIEIQTNRRDVIKPFELDIFIPSFNKAIEFNGMRWHYNKQTCKKEKGYHGMKSKLCREKGIVLLHVREDLWKRKKENMKETIQQFIYGK